MSFNQFGMPIPMPSNIGQAGSPAPSTTQNQSGAIDYSQFLPSSSQLQSFAPLQYQQFGQIPYVNASLAQTPGTAQAAFVDPSTLPGALSQYSSLLGATLQPQFQQQDQQLTADLASRGIYDSSAGAQAQQNLWGQQSAALASGISPLVQQFANYYQNDQQTNAANQQAANQLNYEGGLNTNLTNAGALNNAALNNANTYGSVVSGNESNANAYLNYLAQLQQQQQGASYASLLASYDPTANGAGGILGSGQQAASNAYTNAYAAAGQNNGAIANAYGTALSSIPSFFSKNTANNGSFTYNPSQVTTA